MILRMDGGAARLAGLALALCLAAPGVAAAGAAGAATAQPSATPKAAATKPPPASPKSTATPKAAATKPPPASPTATPAPTATSAPPPVADQARQFNAALLELAQAEARLDEQIVQVEDADPPPAGGFELPPAVTAEQATILRCLDELLRLAPTLALPAEQRQLLLDYLALRRDSAELAAKHMLTIIRFELDPAVDELDEQLQQLGIDIGALLGGGAGGELEEFGGGIGGDGGDAGGVEGPEAGDGEAVP